MSCKLFSFFRAHLSLVFKVTLVANEDLAYIIVGESLDLLHPLPHILEGLPVGHVVHYNYAVGPSVITGRQRPEPLLPCCVPYLQLNILPIHLDRLNLEIDSNCIEEILVERVFLKYTQYS